MEDFNIDLIGIIFKMKKYPAYILGKKSLSRLYIFMSGFTMGYHYPNVSNILPGFQNYIAKKYSCSLVISWSNILLLHVKDEEKAFDLFFEELEIFLKENNIEIPEIE